MVNGPWSGDAALTVLGADNWAFAGGIDEAFAGADGAFAGCAERAFAGDADGAFAGGADEASKGNPAGASASDADGTLVPFEVKNLLAFRLGSTIGVSRELISAVSLDSVRVLPMIDNLATNADKSSD